jgi:hypothetical protein
MESDLIVLVPDKNTQYALQGGLHRPQAMGIRPLTVEFLMHSGRDGGVRTTGPELLRLERRSFRHAILMFDHEGSGADAQSVAALELELDQRLRKDWGEDAKAIVIQPEVDIWMWGAENVLREVCNWQDGPGPREWLISNGFVFSEKHKPARPKEALQAVCRQARIPRSSALYEQLAGRLSLERCTDPAYLRLRAQLRAWFSLSQPY